MDLNIKKAFLSPFSEKQWYIKLIFPVIMSACFLIFDKNFHINKLALVVAMFCLAIPYLILWGFYTQFQHNEIYNKSEILPTLHNKIKDYLIYGIKLTGISFIYIIFLALISLLLIPIFIFKANLLIFALLMIVYICMVVFLVLALIFSECSYADNFCFRDALKFKYILKLMSNAKVEILILILISILLSVILKLILTFTNLLLIFYPFFRVFIKLAGFHLTAQIYKIAKKRLENKGIAI